MSSFASQNSPSLSTRFPVEMTDHIIKLLVNDAGTLKACCEVSRVFYIAARSQLRKKFSLTLIAVEKLVQKTVRDEKTHLVEYLILRGPGSYYEDNRFQHMSGAIFKKFLLTKSNYGFHSVGVESIWRGITITFNYIHDIELCDVVFGDFKDFVDIIGSFCSLKTVALSQVRWRQHTGNHFSLPRGQSQPPLRFRFLHLQNENATDFKNWWIAQVPSPILDVLRIDGHGSETNPDVHSFINRFAQSIQKLEIKINMILERRKPSDFKRFPIPRSGITSFHLEGIMLGTSLKSKGEKLIIYMLPTVALFNPEEVVLGILAKQVEDFDSLLWERIDAELSGIKFKNLKMVRVCFIECDVVTSNPNTFESMMRRNLWRLKEKLIIDFE